MAIKKKILISVILAIASMAVGQDAMAQSTIGKPTKKTKTEAAHAAKPATKTAKPVATKRVSSPVPTVAQDSVSGKTKVQEEVFVMPVPTTGFLRGYEWVELGLSVKWAACNVGASRPSDYGWYLAWGATAEDPDKKYNEVTCKTWKKKLGDISGDTIYDAARAIWGSTWRLPTRAECEELVTKCKWEWTTVEGQQGMKVTGPNGNSIFLPPGGFGFMGKWQYDNVNGYYWTSTPAEGDTRGAYNLGFGFAGLNVDPKIREFGQLVRPVTN